jgi:hypothetical protein
MEGLWPMTFLNTVWEGLGGEAMGMILVGLKLEPVMEFIPVLTCSLTLQWRSQFFFDTNFFYKSQTDI